MAYAKFQYPNTTAPTVTLEFDNGEYQGDIGKPQVLQTIATSDYNEMHADTYGDLDLLDFTLNAKVSKTAISGNIATISTVDSFLTTTIVWGANPFYYTRADGSGPYKVKLANTDVKGEEFVNRIAYRFELKGVAE